MQRYGIAIDIGTTTITSGLIELASKREIAACVEKNPQIQFGEDIVSRIGYCINNKAGSDRLHKAVINSINFSIGVLASKAKVDILGIEKIVVAGNTAMEHFFLNEPVDKLAHAPYASTLPSGIIETTADKAGLNVKGSIYIYILPILKSFIGSDITAGILYTRLHKKTGVNLLVDIGTNGEIALSINEKIFIASTAAGPAFEAVNKNFHGSDLIEMVSIMLKNGIINKSGKLAQARDAKITQADIRQIQLAKAAIMAGMLTLMKKLGIQPGDLKNLFIAGKFGNHIDKEAAVNIGLLPNIPKNKIRFAGNAAYKGVALALCSESALYETESIAKNVTHFGLFVRKDFKEEFVKQMGF